MANYPKAVTKSKTLFGVNELIGDQVVLVESPLDVVRLASVGIYAAASYGAMVSKAQIQVLIDVADRIVLALDNDEEGERQADKGAAKHRVILFRNAPSPASRRQAGWWM